MSSIYVPPGNGKPDYSWPAITGVTPMRGSRGIGLEAAIWTANALGLAVVAMVPLAITDGDKRPMEKWKVLGFRSPDKIKESEKFRARCGTGVLPGASGIVVIDIDGPEGEESWARLADGREVSTLTLQTHNGRHLIFRDGGAAYKTQAGQVATGIDVRGRGGLEVIYDPGQPERHFTALDEPAELPGWLSSLLPLAGSRAPRRGGGAGGAGAGGGDLDVDRLVREGIPPGRHDDRMNALALSLRNKNAVGRDTWPLLAGAVLERSGEGVDGNGHAREKFSSDRIMGWWDTADAKVRAEEKEEESGLVRSYADIGRKRTSWIWRGYLARGEMTILDGEKGVAKSLVMEDIAARMTAGRILPGEKTSSGEAFRVIIFTAESSAEKEVGPRLDAANAVVSRVFCPVIGKGKRGKAAEDWILPESAPKFASAIREAGADVAVFDPINDYLAEDINTNNDASIRRALMPLGRVLAGTDCAAVLVRHMNKNTGADAKFRGAGTTAYQNRARIHLIATRIPADLRPESGAQFGIAIVDNNLRRVDRNLVIAYDVVDSEIQSSDEEDEWVPMIDWHGPIEANIDDVLKGSHTRHGPEAEKQEAIREVLARMFEKSDTWPRNQCISELRAEGCSTNDITIRKVRRSLGIITQPVGSEEGKKGIKKWVWTTKTIKGKVRKLVPEDE